MRLSPFRPSLGGRITFGYWTVAALMLAASLFFVLELKALEERVALGQRVTDLFDTVLEIRRFERNYFLHRQDDDRVENGRYLDSADARLAVGRQDFLALASAARLAQLQAALDNYRTQMEAYARAASNRQQAVLLEPKVRNLGKEIVGIAENMVTVEREQTRTSLAAFRLKLLAVIAAMAALIVAAGAALSRRVVGPLKDMEEKVGALCKGQLANMPPVSDDRELVAVVDAFNRMLKELESRQKSLMRSERLVSLGTMLSGVAHELNNPLSNISTSCQILDEEMEECDAATRKMFLQQIDEQTERARRIVRSLLDFAREREFRKESVQLEPLVRQTVGFVRGAIPAKSLVQLDIPEDLFIRADAQRLQQVFVNLIKNAMDVLGPDGRIGISAHMRQARGRPEIPSWGPGCDITGEVVEIEVADNGSGIPPDILPRIFDPFFTTKDVGQGMGLGLFVVYEIVDEHGGCISVATTPGKGTRFTIRLPGEGG